MTGITIPRGVNLNTIISLLGFLSMFATLVLAWANLQAEQKNFSKFAEEQKQINVKDDERLRASELADQGMTALTLQLSAVQGESKSQADRLSRMADGYADQFTDINTSLSQLATQVALVKQSLERIEKWAENRSRRDSPPVQTH